MPEHAGHDPIDELTRLGAELGRAGGDMPLSAAEVRRRGDRIRRRRTALVAGGAALAVAAVTTPVLLLSGPGGTDRDLVTKEPAADLGRGDLLTDDDTRYSDGADWFATDTFEGDGQAAFHLCARDGLTGLGASAVVQREFELRNTRDPQVEVSGDRFAEAIAQFPDAATAAAAYTTISQWVQDCSEQAAGSGTPDYSVVEPRQVDAEVADSEAQIIDAHYGPVPKDLDPTGDAAYIAETGLVRVGDRIAVLGSTVVGQDYDFVDGTPVERMIPRAAELLQPGKASPGEVRTSAPPDDSAVSEGADTPDAAAATTVPDGFALTAGWPAPDGDGTTAGPARDLPALDLTVCGRAVPDRPAPTDRLGATWSRPEDDRRRQLSTYATEDDATAAATAIVAAYRDCPAEEPDADGYAARHALLPGELGDESWVLGTWRTLDDAPAVGIDVVYVVRVGTAVLVVTGANEAGASDPQGDLATTASSMADDAIEVVGQMCAFSAIGC